MKNLKTFKKHRSIEDLTLEARTPEGVGCISENHFWIVTRHGKGVVIGVYSAKDKKVTPCHGFWGDHRLKHFQEYVNSKRNVKRKTKTNRSR